MSRWILCLTKLSRIHRIKQYIEDQIRSGYIALAKTVARHKPRSVSPSYTLLEPLEDRTLFSADLTGSVFADLNRNGAMDLTEPGQTAVTVYLDENDNYALDPGESTAITDSGGNYIFTGLTDGDYKVLAEEPVDWSASVPASWVQDVTIAGSDVSGIDFGVMPDVEVTGLGTADVGVSYSLNLSGPAVNATQWAIDWGDGNVDTLLGSTSVASHTYTIAGSHNIVATVTDTNLGDIEALTHKVTAVNVVTWVGSSSGDWSDSANWSGGALPGWNDRVVINVAGPLTVTHSSGHTQIHSLTSNTEIRITGGTLKVVDTIEVSANFELAGGTIANARILPGLNDEGFRVTTVGYLDGVTLDADVVVQDGTSLYIDNGLTLNGTLTVGDGISSGTPYVRFRGDQTLDGVGSVVMAEYDSRFRVEGTWSTAAHLIVSSGVTVQGIGYIESYYEGHLVNHGTIRSDVAGRSLYVNPDSVINHGIIEAADGILEVGSGAIWTNSGTLRSAGGTLKTFGDWSGAGYIESNAGVLELGGHFDTLAVSNMSYVGGLVRLTGDLNNTSGLMTLGATTTGTWDLQGGYDALRRESSYGTITSGTISSVDGTGLRVTAVGALDGVTLDADVLVEHGTQLYIENGLTLNGTLTVGDGLLSGNPYLKFRGDQTLDGVGTIVLAQYNAWLQIEGTSSTAATLTVSSGVTVRGQGYIDDSYEGHLINHGTIRSEVDGRSLYLRPDSFVNYGVIEAVDGTFEIGLNASWTNHGTARVSSGTLSFYGAWSGMGAIDVSDGVLELDGSFDTSALSNFTRTGGEVWLTGELNNVGQTLTLDVTTGDWLLRGGKIIGGTVDTADGVRLVATGLSTLDGVTLSGDLEVGDNARVYVDNGLTLNGTITLLGAYNKNANLYLRDTQTITGTGDVVMTTAYSGVSLLGAAGEVITFDSGITVRGIGQIYSSSSYSVDLINRGTIRAEGSGMLLLSTVNLASFDNQGTLAVSENSTLMIGDQVISNESAAPSENEIIVRHVGFDSENASVTTSVRLNGLEAQSFTVQQKGETTVFGDLSAPGVYTVRSQMVYGNGHLAIETSLSPQSSPLEQFGARRIGRVTANGGDIAWAGESGLSVDPQWVYSGSTQSGMALLAGGIKLGGRSVTGVPQPGSDGIYRLHDQSVFLLNGKNFRWTNWTPYPSNDATIILSATTYIFEIDYVQGISPAAISHLAEDDDDVVVVDPSRNITEDPIRYFDGTVVCDTSDLVSYGFGDTFGQIRSWTNQTQYTPSDANGRGTSIADLPQLIQFHGNESIGVIATGTDNKVFDRSGANYTSRSYVPDSLSHDSDANEFVFTDTSGNTVTFFDFDDSLPEKQRGQLKSRVDASGTLTYVSAWTAEGEIVEVRRQDALGVDGESWLYSYLDTSNANANKLSNVQQRRPDGMGGWEVVRQVSYAYYDGIESHGMLGDLKTATIQDSSGVTIDTKYYRYYTYGETGGYSHGMKYIFDAASYARLSKAVIGPFTASDAEVAKYAQQHFEYDNVRRVVRHVIQGMGSSQSGNEGLGVFTYSYETSDNPDGTNSWKYKTIETLPSGNRNVVYCNAFGQVMLKVFQNVDDPSNPVLENQDWITYYRYDDDGRVIFEASSSAVTGYDETKADLLDKQPDGNLVYISDNSGLITYHKYYTETNAATGAASGYRSESGFRHGEVGSDVMQLTKQYVRRSVDSIEVFQDSEVTVYENEDGTGALTYDDLSIYLACWHHSAGISDHHTADCKLQ